MKALTVGELKAEFSDLPVQVQKGEDVQILYGRARKPVAVITSIEKNTGEKVCPDVAHPKRVLGT
jgi:antitoxin (DNA-binding transcriptional repressor) of toxin-antitoxin stability system